MITTSTIKVWMTILLDDEIMQNSYFNIGYSHYPELGINMIISYAHVYV